jgi:hypothetical protein
MAALPEPIELVPLCRMTVRLRDPFVLSDCPAGTRMVFEVESGEIEGDRLRGKVAGNANADWAVVDANLLATLDVRLLIETHDGALVFVHYGGRTDLSTGGTSPIYSAPRFDTGDERYSWINKIQCIGKGAHADGVLTYDIAEVR